MDSPGINGKRNAWDLYGHYPDYAHCDVTFKNYEVIWSNPVTDESIRLSCHGGYHNSVDIMKNLSYTIISKSEGEQSYEMSVLWSREYQSH